MAALPLPPESFHFWMVMAVIPTSLYALTLGCKKHQKVSIVIYGAIGLVLLLIAVLLGEHYLGEVGEKALTVVGALIISFAHFNNFKLCQQQDNCGCPSSKQENSKQESIKETANEH